MLLFGGNFKIGKNNGHDQNVVERERKFDDVAGGELNGFFARPPNAQGKCEKHCEQNPNRAPNNSFFEFYRARAAMKYAEVEREEK